MHFKGKSKLGGYGRSYHRHMNVAIPKQPIDNSANYEAVEDVIVGADINEGIDNVAVASSTEDTVITEVIDDQEEILVTEESNPEASDVAEATEEPVSEVTVDNVAEETLEVVKEEEGLSKETKKRTSKKDAKTKTEDGE